MAGDDRSSLAAVLRGLREDAGLSQEELARRAGLSAHAISALERGTRTRPYPHTLRSLAEALGLSEADRSRLIAAVPPRARPARAASDAATARPRDLPVPTTPLLGRDEDVRRVGRLLAEHRLGHPERRGRASARRGWPWPSRGTSGTGTPTAWRSSSWRR